MPILEFIDESLDKIEDAKNVNAITTCISSQENNKLILCAWMTDGEQVKLCHGKGTMTFPFEPLIELGQEMGRSFCKNFRDIDVNCPNCYCVNKDNFKSFSFSQKEDSKFVDITASFHNGQEIPLFGLREKFFNKKGKDGLIQIENEIRDYQIENGIISENVEDSVENIDTMISDTSTNEGMDF